MRHRLLPVAVAVAIVSLVAAACSDSSDSGSSDRDQGSAAAGPDRLVATGPDGYGAVIRRTADGVPHVYADDLKGVVFGQGYASAQDHPCDLVDQILKVNSRRAATFGAGEAEKNVQSDFGWAALGIAERARADWLEVTGDQRMLMESFAAGWNAALDDAGPDGVTDWCTGQGWLRPITAEELYTYTRSIPLLASGARLVDFIAKAQAPAAAPAPATGEGALGDRAGAGGGGGEAPMASNGWAIGSKRSAEGGGMLLGNPHFPWTGELRFWEVQLTTADGTDVYGAQLLGLPGVGIGFTDGVAWTHTVSAGRRFTAYKMALAPGDPTSYLLDGEVKAMTAKEVTIDVLGDDGQMVPRTRSYWTTEFGPVLDFPGIGWTDTATTSYRDANMDNTKFLDQYLAMDRAESLDDLIAAHEKYQAIPLFNTVATDADGTVWYADTSATPYLSPEAIAAYQQRLENDGLTKIAAQANAVLLDGSTSRDRWVDDPEAPWPGVLPWSKLPMAQRDDYVMNANDSYWVANAAATIDGDFSPLQGPRDTARSVRTLENLAVLDDTSPNGPAGGDGKFTLDELTGAALLDGSYTEAQWRNGVVDRCRAATGPVESSALVDKDGAVAVPAGPVDVGRACEILSEWDGHYDVGSVGAVLWREFVEQVPPTDMWATPFAAAQPATTPAGLGPAQKDGADLVLRGLASAIALLDKAGIPLDATLGSQQYDSRVPDQRLPVPGGLGSEGITNVVSYSTGSANTTQQQPDNPKPLTKESTLTAGGYPINYGSSFLMAVEYTDDGPTARTILTYGEVGDPDSADFTSQVKDFAAKKWKSVRFTEADIAADEDAEVTEVSG